MGNKNSVAERCDKVINFIQQHQAAKGYPPTIREIGSGIGVKSTFMISYYLDKLEDKKMIVRDNFVSRSIRVVHQNEEKFYVYKKDNGLLGIYQTQKHGLELWGTFDTWEKAQDFCKEIDEGRD
jgi:SOS-response transcriptional repressor LexA